MPAGVQQGLHGRPAEGVQGLLEQQEEHGDGVVGPLVPQRRGDAPGQSGLPPVHGGQEPLGHHHVEVGDLQGAKRFLAMAPQAKANDPAIAGARAAIELAEQAGSLGDLADLQRQVETDPSDHQARFDLAIGLNARGRRGEAVDHLLEIVRRDRNWNDDGARKQLVQFFEAWGPMDEMTLAGRRRLSSLLFA